MVDLHARATELLCEWWPAEHAQESLRQGYLGFLAARADACARECVAGHLTASAVVLDASGEHVLLTLHPRVGRWLQLGGHCEPEDASLPEAALREAREESGMDDLTIVPDPIHLGVHPITCSLGEPTRHFDVRFVVNAPAGAEPVRSEESDDLRWWPVTALPPGSEELRELVSAALEASASSKRGSRSSPTRGLTVLGRDTVRGSPPTPPSASTATTPTTPDEI